jgi:hypothetical protein
MSIERSAGGVMVTGKGIELFRLVALKQGLKLQAVGIRMSSKIPQATTICRKQYGLKGTLPKLLAQVEALIAAASAQVTRVEEGAVEGAEVV